MLSLALALIVSQTPGPWLFKQPNLPRDSYAYFEAFPASGAGTFGACSTTPPTGAKGEVLTFTRASAGTCTREGLATTGLNNSSLSTVATNVPRVEYTVDGVLALLSEETRTNVALKSEALDVTGTWVAFSTSPTRWANAGQAPDGGWTADRLLFFNSSIVYQAVGGSGVASAYVKGCIAATDGGCITEPLYFSGFDGGAGWDGGVVYADGGPAVGLDGGSGNGDIGVARDNGSGTTGNACHVPFNAVTWARPMTTTNRAGSISIGNDQRATGCVGGTFAYADVLVWGAQAEQSVAVGTSYIPTDTVSVARAVSSASFATTLSGPTLSAAASYGAPAVLTTAATVFQLYVDASNSITASVSAAGKLTCTFRVGGVDSTVDSAGALTASAVNRVACQYDGTSRKACLGGVCASTAGALTMPTGAATFYVGARSAAGNEANGLIHQLCYDPNDARCL